MKLNASYTLGTGTSVDPAYLAPSFGLLSDSSDVLTSSTKVLGSSNSGSYSAAGGSYNSTAESSIVMDLGSLKAVTLLRIKGSFALEYANGQFLPSSANITLYSIEQLNSAGVVISNIGTFGNFPYKLISGDSGIYNATSDLEYFIMDSNYDCAASFPSPVPNNTPKFFGYSPTARYKIQYSITGAGFLDFQDNIIDTPLNKNVDLTINIPSTIGSIRYIKLTLISTTSQPRIQNNIAYKSTSARNIAYKLLANQYSVLTAYGTVGTPPYISLTLPAATDVLYIAVKPASGYAVVTSGFYAQYSTSDTGAWVNWPTIQNTTTFSDGVIVCRFPTPLIGVKRLKLVVYSISGTFEGTSSYGQATFFNVATQGCLVFGLSGSTIQMTTGNILNSAMTLSEFYADDGVAPPSITFTGGTGDRTVTYIDTPAVPFTLYELWTVTSGTTTWSWQVQPIGATTWTDWSPSGGSGPSTNASITLNLAPFGIANGNKYRVVVRSSEGTVLGTSRITTVTVPGPSITFNGDTADRTVNVTGSSVTLSESWTVTSGTTTWKWQVQGPTSTTWQDILVAGGSGSGTNASLTPLAIGNGDKFRVIVSSSGGTGLGTSRITTVTVPIPVITINSAILPSSYQLGDPALVLSVAASVSPSQTLSYKWQKKTPGSVAYTDLSSIGSTLTIPTSDLELVDSGTSYKVIVSSTGANDVSREVTITVTEPQPILIIDALINNAPAVLYNNIIEEGQTLKLDITAKNITANAVYWKIASDPTTQGNPAGGQDIEGGTIGGALPLSTVTSITSPRTASLSLIVLKDNLTEGNELLQLEFYSNATYSSSALLTRSNIYTIKDTSIGSQPLPTPPTPSSSDQPKTECFEIGFKNLITKTPTCTQTSTQTPTMTKTPSPTSTRTPRVLPTNEPTKTPPGSPTPTRTPTPTKIIDCWAPGSGGGNPAYAVVPSCPNCTTAVLIGTRKVILLDGSNCWEWIWDCVYIPDCEPTAIP